MAAEMILEIAQFVEKGRAKNVKALVEQAISEGISAKTILDEGLLNGMMVVGDKFKRNEVFVPEVLVAARAMNAGVSILEPLLAEAGNEPLGKAIVATVKGDLHDIGKNLVAMMFKGAGLEVIDLGVDIDAETFVAKAEEVGADIIGMSALLTTTMPTMKEVVDLLKEKGLRDKYIVMVGGAPVNQRYADEIGADYYTSDAASAAETAKKALIEKKA